MHDAWDSSEICELTAGKSDAPALCLALLPSSCRAPAFYFRYLLMQNDPAFLFYSDNFLSGTMFFTYEQIGRYIKALCAQHQTGHLTEAQLDSIIASDPEIKKKFKPDNEGLFYNIRLQAEIDKRKVYCDLQSQRASDGWKKRKENATALPRHESGIDPAMPEGKGNENGNGNSLLSVLKNKKKDRKREDRTESKTTIIPEHLQELWPAFEEMRKKIGAPLTVRAVALTIKNLQELAPNSLADQVKILEQSIQRSYRGVFALKESGGEYTKPRRYGRQEVSMEEIKAQMERIVLK